MIAVLRFLNSSIIKKYLMALTGLGLVGFLVMHLLGNILIAVSPQAFNQYAYQLTSNPLIYVAEAGLAAVFLVHMGLAFRLTWQNRMARPESYQRRVNSGRGATFASDTMIWSGLVIFVFLVFHIQHFKFGSEYYVLVDGVQMRDLARTVYEYFANPLNVAWYVFAMSCVSLHLVHGIQSAFQSLGIRHPRYTPSMRCLGRWAAVALGAGFSFLAVYCYVVGGQ